MKKYARDHAACQQIAANKRDLAYTKMCAHTFPPKHVSAEALEEEQPRGGKKEISKDTHMAFYTSKMFGLM